MSFSKKRSRTVRLGRIEREILEELSYGDMLIGALFSARSTKRMHQIARKRAKERYLARRAAERLVSEGLVTMRDGKFAISVSGNELLKRTELVKQALNKAQWDGKWRVVVFDIPQSVRGLRWELRTILKRAGFQMLQQSVWMFPHECKELTDLIKQDKRIREHVLYGVFESIEGDAEMRRAFKLR